MHRSQKSLKTDKLENDKHPIAWRQSAGGNKTQLLVVLIYCRFLLSSYIKDNAVNGIGVGLANSCLFILLYMLEIHAGRAVKRKKSKNETFALPFDGVAGLQQKHTGSISHPIRV